MALLISKCVQHVFIETGRKFNPKESFSFKLVPEAFETRASIAGHN
jgi:hypothetical protein